MAARMAGTPPHRHRARKVILVLLIAVLAAGVIYALGPRPPADTTITFDPASLPDDLDAYLAAEEARFPDIKPGNRKQIVWAYPASKARTPYSIVYVHGFSAGPGEVRPLPDIIGEDLGANIYYTRLTGHGRSGDAMLDGSVNRWVNDLAEALAIGRRLGERVVVIATSTGATLAAWGAAQPDLFEDVAGLVQISPNYGVNAPGAFLLTGPWAHFLVPLIVGERRAFEPRSPAHERYWTTDYPSLALLPMAALVKLAAGSDFSKIETPALFIYSPNDQVVRPDLTRDVAAAWGARADTIEVEESGDPHNHVIAGDVFSPQTTGPLADKITEWIRSL